MGFLEDAVGSAVPGGNVGKPLMIALGALLASGALFGRGSSAGSTAAPTPGSSVGTGGGLLGGLGGLINRFQQSGQGDVISSWIGSGPNREIAPHQLGSVLGPDVVKSLSEKSGLSQQDLMAQLSKVLPGVVDGLTPAGRLPTDAEIAATR
jgi:uncharacterized protein YidB (DUF937 family)